MDSLKSRNPAPGAGLAPPGAYGLHLLGVDGSRSLLVSADEAWPQLELVRRIGAATEAGGDSFRSSEARVRLSNGGEILIRREPGQAIFKAPQLPSVDELLHPYLAPVAAIVAYWLERESFHAGAFAAGGGAWGLVGDRESGKSSTLAWLALEGHPVLCDDMLVLNGRTAFAAPRIIDLRPEAAAALGVGEFLGVVGARERWRLELESIEPSLPLRGWVFLEWGDRVEAAPLAPLERVARLSAARGVRLAPHDPGAVLELASLPAWELRRPHGFDSLAAAGRGLLELVGG